MAQQHWSSSHWPSGHWVDNHWAAAAPFNHWPEGHFAPSHFALAHWPAIGEPPGSLIAVLPQFTAEASGELTARTLFEVEYVIDVITTSVVGAYFEASAALDLPALVAIASGTAAGGVTGTIDATLPQFTASGVGSWRFDLSGSADLPGFVAVGTGTTAAAPSGSIDVSLPQLIAVGTGTAYLEGSLDASLPAIEAEASGTAEPNRSGDVDAYLPSFVAVAFGAFGSAVDGSGVVFLPSLSASGTGTLTFPSVAGDIDATLPQFTAIAAGGFGAPAFGGNIDVSLPPLTITAIGEVSFTGSISVQLPPLEASAAATFEPGLVNGVLVAELPALTALGFESPQVTYVSRYARVRAPRRALVFSAPSRRM